MSEREVGLQLIKVLLLTCFCVTNILLAADDCSLSYLPLKITDKSLVALESYRKNLIDNLNVEIKLVSNLKEEKLTSKFLIASKEKYEQLGIRYIKSSAIDLFSKKFSSILEKAKKSRFNKNYEKLLRISETEYKKIQGSDHGLYFLILATPSNTGSYLNSLASWANRISGTKLSVSAEGIENWELSALYEKNDEMIFMDLDEAVRAHIPETGIYLHELAHSFFEKQRSRGINSLFSTALIYNKTKSNLFYPDSLSFEEIYTSIGDIDRSLYALKREYVSGGKYLNVQGHQNIGDMLHESVEALEENTTVSLSYINKAIHYIKSKKFDAKVRYEFFEDGRNGFDIDLEIGDAKVLYDVFLDQKLNISKIQKTDKSLNQFMRKELLKQIEKQKELFKEILLTIQPLSKKMSLFGEEDDVVLSFAEVERLHVVSKKLRSLVRGK